MVACFVFGKVATSTHSFFLKDFGALVLFPKLPAGMVRCFEV